MYIHMIIIYDIYIYMNNIYIYISASDERLAVPPKARFHEPHHGASLPVYADARCRWSYFGESQIGCSKIDIYHNLLRLRCRDYISKSLIWWSMVVSMNFHEHLSSSRPIVHVSCCFLGVNFMFSGFVSRQFFSDHEGVAPKKREPVADPNPGWMGPKVSFWHGTWRLASSSGWHLSPSKRARVAELARDTARVGGDTLLKVKSAKW